MHCPARGGPQRSRLGRLRASEWLDERLCAICLVPGRRTLVISVEISTILTFPMRARADWAENFRKSRECARGPCGVPGSVLRCLLRRAREIYRFGPWKPPKTVTLSVAGGVHGLIIFATPKRERARTLNALYAGV